MTHEERAALGQLLDKAHRTVAAICNGTRRWTMSVPARPDEDPDLIIAGALGKSRAMLADYDELERKVRELERIVTALESAMNPEDASAALRSRGGREMSEPIFCGDCKTLRAHSGPCPVLHFYERPGGPPGNHQCFCGHPVIQQTITFTDQSELAALREEQNAIKNVFSSRGVGWGYSVDVPVTLKQARWH